jgi:DNA-binding IclR family transcriptional regulator
MNAATDLPPFAVYLYRVIDRMARQNGGPVRTLLIAETLGQPTRTVRRYVQRLERAGLIARHSPRGGYAPRRMAGEARSS